MSGTFTKLASSITESTVWAEPDRTRIVWITMLAMADQFGRVNAAVQGLANRARVPVEDCRIALAAFLAPDPDSRTREHEGRRIEEIDGGWRLLNHGKYRELRSSDDRKEQLRAAQQRRRERLKAEKLASSSNVMTLLTRDDKSSESAQAEAEADTEAKRKRNARAARKQAGFDAAAIELPDWLEQDIWQRWCKERKNQKKPISEEAARLQLKALDCFRAEGQSPESVIEHAIASGHQGLYGKSGKAPRKPATDLRAIDYAEPAR